MARASRVLRAVMAEDVERGDWLYVAMPGSVDTEAHCQMSWPVVSSVRRRDDDSVVIFAGRLEGFVFDADELVCVWRQQ